MSSVDINQIKNENDMINLSQSQLKSYADTVSSFVSIEESTIRGLEKERLYFEGLEYNLQLEIDNLTNAINISSFQLSEAVQQESTLSRQSTTVQAQIASTMKAIDEQDSTMRGTGGEISSLTREKQRLEGEIIVKDNAFKSAAATYSDKYTAYVQKVKDYDDLMQNIQNVCTLIVSSSQVASNSQATWEKSASTLAGYSRQMSTLKDQETYYLGVETSIRADIDQTDRNILSTFASVQNWSSFLKTALMNKRYIELVSSLQGDLREASDATEVYNRYFQRFMSQVGGQAGVTPIVDTPMTNSELSTMVFQQKRRMDSLTARVAEGQRAVNNASTTLESAAMSSFEIAVAGFDKQLAFEYSTLYQYREQGKKAREVTIPFYTNLRNSTYTAALKAMSNSQMYSEAYISTFIGYNQMLDSRFELQGQVLSNADDAYYAEKNLIEYITNLYGSDYLPIPGIRAAVNTYSDANLRQYQSRRQGWTPGGYMSSLAAERASVTGPIIDVIDITGPPQSTRVTDANVQLFSSCSAQFISPQMSSLIARGDISTIARQNQVASSFAAKGDLSSLNLVCTQLVSQRGGQLQPFDNETIDQALANEIFDVSYLLYSQGTPGAPSSLRINNQTVNFMSPLPYVPRSIATFGRMGGDVSSLAGWSAISTQKAKEYDDAMALVNTYNQRYVSVSDALSSFSRNIASALSNITTLGYQSSMIIENINKLNIQLAKEGVELLNAFNTQERATYEYRESYVREVRVGIQNRYEDAIKSEIATRSSIKGAEFASRGDTSSVVNYLNEINFNTGLIGMTYSNFQDITSTLSLFSNLYQRYDNRGFELSNYTSNSSNYINLYNEFSELIMSNIQTPNVTNLLSQMATKYVTLSNTKNSLDQIQAKFPGLTSAIDQQKPVVFSDYQKVINNNQTLVNNTTVTMIETDISSFLSNAYVAGFSSFVA